MDKYKTLKYLCQVFLIGYGGKEEEVRNLEYILVEIRKENSCQLEFGIGNQSSQRKTTAGKAKSRLL